MIPAKRGDMYQRSAVPKKNSWRGTFPKSAAKLLRETDLKRQGSETMKKKLYFEAEKRLLDTDCIDSDDRCFRLRELFTTDIEGVESVGSVGSVFQKILLRFGQFLAGLVLTETESASGDACGLDGKEEIVVILPIEERHEVLQPLEAIVDK